MSKTLKQIAKKCIIGGVFCIILDFGYQMGKGRMIRLMIDNNKSGQEILDLLSSEDHQNLTAIEEARLKIIKSFATLKI